MRFLEVIMIVFLRQLNLCYTCLLPHKNRLIISASSDETIQINPFKNVFNVLKIFFHLNLYYKFPSSEVKKGEKNFNYLYIHAKPLQLC